jgi:hypothetical protein
MTGVGCKAAVKSATDRAFCAGPVISNMAEQAPGHDELRAALDPPRFSLRTLLVVMTALGCLFGLMTAVGSVWSMVILLFLGLVSAHVLGNSLGTKLRDRASRQVAIETARHAPARAGAPRLEVEPGRLTQRTRLSRITFFMALGGAVAGAFLGGTGLAGIYPEASAPAVALGVVSLAVLGAFAGFMASSFLSVMHQAWREALAHCDSVAGSGAGRRPL